MTAVKFVVSIICLLIGAAFLIFAAIGVNRFDKALNRMHAAALGDTLGILFVIVGLVVWKGLHFVSFKLLFMVFFFWLASPVAGHMISRLEAETDDDLGEIEVEHRENI